MLIALELPDQLNHGRSCHQVPPDSDREQDNDDCFGHDQYTKLNEEDSLVPHNELQVAQKCIILRLSLLVQYPASSYQYVHNVRRIHQNNERQEGQIVKK